MWEREAGAGVVEYFLIIEGCEVQHPTAPTHILLAACQHR